MFEIICFLSIISILANQSIGDQFCDLYVKHDYKVLVHSPDNENLILFVEDKHWIVNENNSELIFNTRYFQPNGSSNLQAGQWSSPFSINFTADLVEGYTKNAVIISHIFGYYEPKRTEHNNPLGFIGFLSGNVEFIHLCHNGKLSEELGGGECGHYSGAINLDDIRRSVSFRVSEPKNRIFANIFVNQTFDRSTNKYERKLFKVKIIILNSPTEWSDKYINFFVKPYSETSDYSFIEEMDPTIEVIGVFQTYTEETVHVLFRQNNNKTIKYCTVFKNGQNDCKEKKYKVLIDCSNASSLSKLILIWIIISILVVFLAIMIVIAIVVIVKKRSYRVIRQNSVFERYEKTLDRPHDSSTTGKTLSESETASNHNSNTKGSTI